MTYQGNALEGLPHPWPPPDVDWYYSDPWVAIAHGDSQEMMTKLPKAGLVLTDPPYGIGKKMQGGTWGAHPKYADLRRWDKKPAQEVITEAVDQAAAAIVWGGNHFSMPPSRCWLVWDKVNAVHTMSDCELAWTNLDRPTKRLRLPVGNHPSGHPTEKPIRLMSWCLAFVPTGVVLDPFMGSGTTLRAAKDLNRRAIGIEIEERYCEIAVRRMAQEVLDFT